MEFNFDFFKPKPDLSIDENTFGPRIGRTSEAEQIAFNSSHNGAFCWWTLNSTKIDPIPVYVNQNTRTDTVYSNPESDFGGVIFALLSIPGALLNFLLIAALLKNTKIRQEYLTKTVVSIAMTDFLWSIFWLPIMSLRYATR